MDKLTAIKTFIKVAETGKFSAAADVMGIPPPRATQRVRDLENYLRVRLLDRTTKSLALTPEGAEYLDACRRIVRELEEVEDTLHGQTIGATGNLRIEAISSIGRRVIAPRLNEFQADNPAIQIAMGCSDRVALLAGAGIDCFLRGGVLDDSSYIAKPLCSIHFGLYAAPDQASVIQRPIDLEQAKRIGIYVSHPESASAWALQSGDSVVRVEVAGGLLFDDTEAAVAAAANGCGIVAAPVFLAAPLVFSGQLSPVLPHWSAGIKPLNALYPSTRHTPRRLRKFLEWVEGVLHQHPHLTAEPIEIA